MTTKTSPMKLAIGRHFSKRMRWHCTIVNRGKDCTHLYRGTRRWLGSSTRHLATQIANENNEGQKHNTSNRPSTTAVVKTSGHYINSSFHFNYETINLLVIFIKVKLSHSFAFILTQYPRFHQYLSRYSSRYTFQDMRT